jgi:hypothetical protein
LIKRFNFYDIYGFLIPGSALVVGLWLPYGLIGGKWPDRELASLGAALALGYVSGHILQVIAHKALPSKSRDALKQLRYPSDIFLDHDDKTFSKPFKTLLATRIKNEFFIDIEEETDDRSTRRLDAFLLCRASLMQAGRLSYAEQFEGLYALSRGLTAAFFLSALYHCGWGLAKCWEVTANTSGWIIGITAAITILALLLHHLSLSWSELKTFQKSYWSLIPLALGFVAVGHRLGVHRGQDSFGPIFFLNARIIRM